MWAAWQSGGCDAWGRGGGVGLASHRHPSDCLHHLGNKLVILSPVPSVWHCCSLGSPGDRSYQLAAQPQVLPCLLPAPKPKRCAMGLTQPCNESLK